MKKYLVFVSVAFFAFISSCTNDTTFQSSQRDAAQRGRVLMQQVNELYATLNEMNYYFDYKREYLEILTKSDTSIVNLYSNINFNNLQLDSISDFVQKTSAVYQSYELLSDLTIGLEKSGIVYNIDRFCSLASSLNVSEDDKILIDQIYKAANSNKFERKDIILAVNQIFLKIFIEDIDKQSEILNHLFLAYDKGLKKVPNSAFDIQKVELLVNEPYSDSDVLLGLYKLQLRDDAYKKKQAVIGRIQSLKITAEKLNLLHAELLRKQKNNAEIARLLSDIDLVLNIEQ